MYALKMYALKRRQKEVSGMAGKRAQSPVQGRINCEWDHIKALLAGMHFDRAELIREEILIILVLMKTEIIRQQTKYRGSVPAYREGSVAESVGVDYDALVEVARYYAEDFTRLVT
jgi:hypothetical protein